MSSTRTRPGDWWMPEDWDVILTALEFAGSYGKPEGCPRWVIDSLIRRAEVERQRWFSTTEERLRAERKYRESRRTLALETLNGIESAS